MASIDIREPTGSIPDHLSSNGSRPSYRIPEKPLGSRKHIRIVGIGAGASGLNMIRTLRLNLRDFELIVYEKNEEVGGTWFENRYPGCRCDVPSHSYQFTWKPNHEWSNFFSPAQEIKDYLCRICNEEGMRDVIKTRHQVVHAEWKEARGIWVLQVQNLETGKVFEEYAHFLLNGSGILNNWKWPDVADCDAFEGRLIHTASWPKDFDPSGKVVAIIGNGSTGVQLLPEIQSRVKQLYHVVRTPTWVVPPRLQTMIFTDKVKDILSQIELDDKENFSQATIQKFKSDPEFYRHFVKGIEREVNSGFPIMLKDGPVQKIVRGMVTEYMTAKLGGNEKLCKLLIPTHPLGCRRITPAPGYLEALTKPNVEVVPGIMKQFVSEGIEMDSGRILKVEAIICATGFDVSFRPRFPLIGREGNLQDIWESELPKAYMSCAVPGLPNYFTFLGPNAPIGHGSVFTLSEHIAKYITRVIRKCQTESIKAIVPSQAASDDYAEHVAAFMPRTVWAAPGKSWFKRGAEEGPVVALHPGSRIHFMSMLEDFRGEDWDYIYDADDGDGDGENSWSRLPEGGSGRQNRFRYLGNGFSTKELDPNDDPTWYLDSSSVI